MRVPITMLSLQPLRWMWPFLLRFTARVFYGFVDFFRLVFDEPREVSVDEDIIEQGKKISQLDAPATTGPNEPVESPTSITYRHVEIGPNMETPKPGPGEIIYVSKGVFITRGGTAIVERLPSGEVVKTPTPNPFCRAEEGDCRQNMRVEAQAYEKIGEHRCIPRFIRWDSSTCCLTVEYLENGNLREYMRENREKIPSRLRISWAQQAAEGLQVLHSKGIVHCDVSPRNFLLDSDLNLKISDFAGSSLCGSSPSAYPDPRYRRPDCDLDVPCFQDDVFGLGSLIYFIVTATYPYEELPSNEVDNLYKCRRFPDVADLKCGDIIEQCWCQQVDAAQVYKLFQNSE